MSYLLSIDYLWIYLAGILLFGYSQWILANARGRLIHANKPVPESKNGSSTAVLLVAFIIMGGTGNKLMLLLGLLVAIIVVYRELPQARDFEENYRKSYYWSHLYVFLSLCMYVLGNYVRVTSGNPM